MGVFRPYLPYLEYGIQYRYYKEVLCKNKTLPELNCNGKCILAQKLKQAAAQSAPDAPVPPEGPQLEDFLLGELPIQAGQACLNGFRISLALEVLPHQAPEIATPTPPPWA